jgi:hypothetical protein
VPTLPQTRRKPALLLSLSSLALLAACGGGGGGAVDLSAYLSDFAAPAPVDIAVLTQGYANASGVTAAAVNALLNSTQYANTPAGLAWIRGYPEFSDASGTNYPLRSSGAAFAHAADLDGTGQVIAFSDSHLSATHESLGGRVTLLSNGPAGEEHGTSVASVALGFSPNFIGTAPNATGIFGYYGDAGDWDTLTALGQAAIAANAVAWNNSWGYSGLNITESGIGSAFAGLEGNAYYSTLDTYTNTGVVVFAVSNDDTGNAGVMDGLPYLRPDFEAGWLAAANGLPTLSADGDVTSVYLLSSPCYESARWCIVADGSWKAAVGSGSDYAETTGSSFAAPQVSGALALLAEAFPDLTPHELRIRLLASADDSFSGFSAEDTVELATDFFKDYSVIYGHGFLDIEAALGPIGATSMAMANGGTVKTNAALMRTGSAMGDAVERSLAGTNVAVRDSLAAGFVMPADALTAGARPGAQGGALLAKALRGNLAAERQADPAALATPFAAFAGPVMTMATPDGGASAAVLVPQDGSDSTGFSLTRALTDGAMRIDLGLKLARDDGTLMSLDGRDSAAMASVTLGITQDLGAGAFLALSGEVGVTDLGGTTALGSPGSARFDALKLTAGQSDVFTRGDRLTLGVGMPVAIASGETSLTLPVVREGAAASFESIAVDLAPEDRQLDLEMTYQTALSDGLEMKLSLIHSDDFGNRAGATDTSGAIAFAFRF